ncbi:MAG: STAS domain-containing protein [Leptolyngbyaceae bacterium]|nr:STAS domain-containing protein [Leptolyngbyaceae bacterium]
MANLRFYNETVFRSSSQPLAEFFIGMNTTSMSKVNVFQPTRILTSINAVDVQEWARECLETHEKVLLIDLRNVSFMDSSGLGALISIQRMVQSHGGELALCNIQGQARMLLDMTTTSQMFSIYENQAEFESQLKVG